MSEYSYAGTNGKIRTLLVDDNQVFSQAANNFVKRHQELTLIGAFPNTEKALASVEALQPHVVLLDLDMPGHAGLETIHRLRDLLPQVGIIVLTLLKGESFRQAALAAGAHDYVPKVTMVTDLMPAIRRVVSGNDNKKDSL
ncbi:MAG: response regulator transcription factor [Anaerolineales bacterium]|nr:response regulator transcription factor [Anaerolineales bacterium]